MQAVLTFSKSSHYGIRRQIELPFFPSVFFLRRVVHSQLTLQCQLRRQIKKKKHLYVLRMLLQVSEHTY
jgi:hypothetical protein